MFARHALPDFAIERMSVMATTPRSAVVTRDVDVMSAVELAAYICHLSATLTEKVIVERSVPAPARPPPPPAPPTDRLVSVREAAKLIGMSEDWLYDNAARLPFAMRQGRNLRFSIQGIQKYIAARAH